MRVEVLTFGGCPNAEKAVVLVRELVVELGIEAEVREIRVENPAGAERMHFLGSPTIRIDGKDVEPGADKRSDYVLACRVYRTSAGISGVPDRAWVQQALMAGHR